MTSSPAPILKRNRPKFLAFEGASQMPNRIMTASALVGLTVCTGAVNAVAQEKIRISYSSADATNAVYFIAQDRGLYKKYGVDTDLAFIQSTPISVTSIIAGDVKVGNAAGNAV